MKMDYWPQGNGYPSYRRNRNLTRHFRLAAAENHHRYKGSGMFPYGIWVLTTPHGSDGIVVIAVDNHEPESATTCRQIHRWLVAEFKPPLWRVLRGTESAYSHYLDVIDEALLFHKLEGRA